MKILTPGTPLAQRAFSDKPVKRRIYAPAPQTVNPQLAEK